MTRTMMLVAIALLSGCAQMERILQPRVRQNIAIYESQCRAAQFAVYGSCIRDGLTAGYPGWRADEHADLVDVYLSWLDAAGKRVTAGTMSEPDARLGAAEIKLRLQQIASERETNAALRQQAGIQQMLAGFALLEAAQPRPAYVPAPMQGPIICTQYPTNRISGTTQTVCN